MTTLRPDDPVIMVATRAMAQALTLSNAIPPMSPGVKREHFDVEADDEVEYVATKRARTVKSVTKSKKALTADEEEFLEAAPKPTKGRKKAAKAPPATHVDTSLPRPPGERKPAKIWDVPKKKNRPMPAKGPVTEWPKPRINYVKTLKAGQEEVRTQDFVDEAPDWYFEALHRARTHRMHLMERIRGVEEQCHAGHDDCPVEIIRLAGSTGNVYTIYISHQPTCTCPDYTFRRRACKHISYVLHFVLKAPEYLCFQDGLLTSELRQIAAAAPKIEQIEDADSIRKPLGDDCPVCCQEMTEEEQLVWCQAACGNNLHKSCFTQWEKSQAQRRMAVTCPLCRTDWLDNKPQVMASTLQLPKAYDEKGFINVRDQLNYD